ncbi:hypothetical protein BC936DRAFT_144760 [Jimgerdemannia flammicorona]|uniref:WD40-repeat-containing domain protein n=1 Tax=Jimgerdemannia flammicorona TaxID=994334 RepID=A0A433DBS3_9FUNG|nr:hypothetical protein BC936DRAFT_144760 [Jimgerdemannia flammicorona]
MLTVPLFSSTIQVSNLFRSVIRTSHLFHLFKQTTEMILSDDISDFPDYLPASATDNRWGALALGLHRREQNWRTGQVSHITRLTDLPSSNIGRMVLRYPYFVASFLDDDSFRIWNMDTGKMRLLTTLGGLQIKMMDIVVGNLTVVAAFENHKAVKVYSIETGYLKDTYLCLQDNGPITALRVEEELIVAGYDNGSVCAWDRYGVMEYNPPAGRYWGKVLFHFLLQQITWLPLTLQIVAMDIYQSYIICLSSSGRVQIHSTEANNSNNALTLRNAFTLPRMPPRSTVHFGAFSAASTGPISLMAAVSEPLTDESPEGTIFNFHQDVEYHIYHCVWNTGGDTDAPTRPPRIRVWDTQTPDHGVRWDTFAHASKERCCVIETETNTNRPRVRLLLPREKRTVKSLWSKDPKVKKVLSNIGMDGWVPQLGVDDDTIVLTGQWEVLYVLHFATPSFEKLKQELYKTNAPLNPNAAGAY